MHSALTLRSWAPDFKTQMPGVQIFMKSFNTAAPKILQTMLHTLGKIGNVSLYGAFVLHCPTNTLSNFHCCLSPKIPIIRALLHSINRTHATILLQPHTISKEILTRSFLGPCKETATHHR